MHQISEAKTAGYDEADIVSSVIRAMSPSLTLRNVLETTKDLKLEILVEYIEAHYDERNATDLCSKLTSMSQSPEESAYSFAMRCIEVRQKVIRASEKSDIQYDEPLVNKLFLRTLERGLISGYVLQEIKPFLRSYTSDSALINCINKASAAEKERQAVQCKSLKKSTSKVYELKSEMSGKSEASPSENNMSKLLSAVETLSTQMSSMRSEMNDLKAKRQYDSKYYGKCESKYENNRERFDRKKCEKCKEGERCQHCYKCGVDGHMARNCRSSGNSR